MRHDHTTDPIFQQRFFSSTVRAMSGCLEWTRYKNACGYGCVECDGKIQLAHRVAWQIANGPIPEGMNVLHHCDRPACVDVDHLFLGTQTDNIHDRHQKGRDGDHRGERNGLAKLTEADVLEIRRTYVRGSHEFGLRSLAKRFGVTYGLIGFIVRREQWRHV